MRYVTTSYDVEYCAKCGKRRYATWRDAARVAERQRNRQGVLVQPYHSRECDAFHVGAPSHTQHSSMRNQNGPRRHEQDEQVESIGSLSGQLAASQGHGDD